MQLLTKDSDVEKQLLTIRGERGTRGAAGDAPFSSGRNANFTSSCDRHHVRDIPALRVRAERYDEPVFT